MAPFVKIDPKSPLFALTRSAFTSSTFISPDITKLPSAFLYISLFDGTTPKTTATPTIDILLSELELFITVSLLKLPDENVPIPISKLLSFCTQ